MTPPPESSAQPPSPPDAATPEVTELLLAWGRGDRVAFDALMDVVAGDLRRIAEREMRGESAGHTLQPTALVNEAYLRLVRQDRVQWQNRAQFYGVAAVAMERVLVDHARRKRAAKGGGGVVHVTLTGAEELASGPPSDGLDVITLHDALERLAALDPRQADAVRLRYFADLTIPETAAALGVSPATVKRDLDMGTAWLRRELAPR